MDSSRISEKLSSETFEAFELEWDSNYFGVKSAKVVLKENISNDDYNRITRFLAAFDFVTIVNVGNNSFNNLWLGKETSAFLTDMNIQFKKKINISPQIVVENIKINNNYSGHDTLVNIAQNSFIYSRFFNDPFLSKEKAMNIYVHWVNSAFNKSQRFFIIAERQGNIAGFLLYSVDFESGTATIDLIAVGQVYQGQNVGRSLVTEFESAVYESGISLLKVGTQANNISAVNFYNKCGYKLSSINSVYHFWPQKRHSMERII